MERQYSAEMLENLTDQAIDLAQAAHNGNTRDLHGYFFVITRCSVKEPPERLVGLPVYHFPHVNSGGKRDYLWLVCDDEKTIVYVNASDGQMTLNQPELPAYIHEVFKQLAPPQGEVS